MTRISPTKDGGFSTGFHTNEITDEQQRANMVNMYNKFGWLVFASQDIYEIPAEPPKKESSPKTPSQRLRGVLFRLYEHRGSPGTFDDFYERQYEAIIERIKKELPERP